MTTLTTTMRGAIRVQVQSIFNCLPLKAKRLIFVSSLFKIINDVKAPDAALIKKLNDVLQVAKNSGAWELPMTVCSLIWTDLCTNVLTLPSGNMLMCDLKTKDLPEEKELEVANWFIDKMPPWLRYGSDDLLQHDVISLITQLRKLERV